MASNSWGCPDIKGLHSNSINQLLFLGLKVNPLSVNVEDWSTGGKVGWVLNDQRFVAVVYSALYSSELLGDVAEFINDIVQSGSPKAPYLLELFYNQTFDASFNSMLYFATECNDNPLVSKAEFNQSLKAVGGIADVFEAEWRWDVCRNPLLMPGQLPAMRVLDIPVLLAVGEYDPVTPRKYGVQLMQWLSKGYGLVQPKKSHAEFYSSDCGKALIPQFLVSQGAVEPSGWQQQLKGVGACGQSFTM